PPNAGQDAAHGRHRRRGRRRNDGPPSGASALARSYTGQPMPSVSTFMAWAESLPTLSYYAILRVPPEATPGQVNSAYHSFALRCKPDRYVDEGGGLSRAAAEVFKPGVEAYNVWSKPSLRERYDKALARGKLRLDLDAVESVPAPPQGKSLQDV